MINPMKMAVTSFSKRKALHNVKDSGYEKDANGAGGKHATYYGSAHDLTSDGACAGSSPQRDAAKDERERGHENWTEAEARAFESRIHERFAFFEFLLGEFNDENGVLGGEADQHDQTDL